MAGKPKGAADYLQQMTRFAAKLNDPGINPAKWAAQKRYVRVNGSGLRPISLCHVNPCGSLAGQKTRKTIRGLEEALGGEIDQPDYIRKKPEHRLQAALIEHALRWPEELPAMLHLQNECEKICFVTDEFKLEQIRADVVMLGCKAGAWFPIFLELKVLRSKKKVVGQVLEIKGRVRRPDIAAEFVRFVKTAAGVGEDVDVDLTKSIAMIVWPAAQGKPLSLEETIAQGIHVLEFEGSPDFAKPYGASELSFTSIA